MKPTATTSQFAEPASRGSQLKRVRRGRVLIQFALIIAIVAGDGLHVHADAMTDEQAVEAGGNALQGPVSFPWYDEKSDGLRPVDVEPPADLKNRQSDWLRKPKKQKVKKKTTSGAAAAFGEAFWLFLRILGWTVLAIALVALGYALVRAFLLAEGSKASDSEPAAAEADPRSDVDRVESLPFQLKETQGDLLSQARSAYEAGNYAEAIVYLYSYQLVELDKHQLIRLTKGKTNRQYLREVRKRRDLFGLLQRTMLVFEDVFFGNHSLERKRFETCWGELEAFHHGLEQLAT